MMRLPGAAWFHEGLTGGRDMKAVVDKVEVELGAERAQVARALAELDAATGEDAIAKQVRLLLRVGLATLRLDRLTLHTGMLQAEQAQALHQDCASNSLTRVRVCYPQQS